MAAFPTSYIPTTSSQVTRSADSAVMTGTNLSSWYRQDEGSFVTEFKGGLESTQGGFGRVISYEGSQTFINAQGVHLGSNSLATWNDSQAVVITLPVSPVNNFVKAAAAYGYNNRTLVSGQQVSTSSAGIGVSSVSTIGIGRNAASPTHMLNGHIRRIIYYPKRLPNNQLQALTA